MQIMRSISYTSFALQCLHGVHFMGLQELSTVEGCHSHAHCGCEGYQQKRRLAGVKGKGRRALARLYNKSQQTGTIHTRVVLEFARSVLTFCALLPFADPFPDMVLALAPRQADPLWHHLALGRA